MCSVAKNYANVLCCSTSKHIINSFDQKDFIIKMYRLDIFLYSTVTSPETKQPFNQNKVDKSLWPSGIGVHLGRNRL